MSNEIQLGSRWSWLAEGEMHQVRYDILARRHREPRANIDMAPDRAAYGPRIDLLPSDTTDGKNKPRQQCHHCLVREIAWF